MGSIRSHLLAAVALAGIVAGSSAHGQEVGITDTTIRLGMFGPLTGAVSIYGYPINNGAIAVYQEVNAQGGINGRKIEIVHEDGSCDPAKTRAAVKKLIENDKVFAVHGGSCSGAVNAAKDEFINGKVPFMVMAATLDAISDPPSRYVFTTTLPGSGDGRVMMDFTKSIPNAKKIAIVRHQDDWANAKMKNIGEGYKAAGLTLVADEQLARNANDATAQVLKIRAAAPDVTLFVLYPAESAVFLRDAEKYGLKGPFIGTNSVMDLLDLRERTGSKTAANNVFVSAFLKGYVGDPSLEQWAQIYRKQFPNDKVQSLSFYGMSGAITMVEAMKKAGRDLTRDKLIAALESVKDGEAGPAFCKVNFDATRRQGCLDATMWTLRDDKIVNIGTSWAKTN